MTINNSVTIRVYVDGVRSQTPASDGITFTSADTTVATVNTAGQVTPLSRGNTTITVAKEGSTSVVINVSVQ